MNVPVGNIRQTFLMVSSPEMIRVSKSDFQEELYIRNRAEVRKSLKLQAPSKQKQLKTVLVCFKKAPLWHWGSLLLRTERLMLIFSHLIARSPSIFLHRRRMLKSDSNHCSVLSVPIQASSCAFSPLFPTENSLGGRSFFVCIFLGGDFSFETFCFHLASKWNMGFRHRC